MFNKHPLNMWNYNMFIKWIYSLSNAKSIKSLSITKCERRKIFRNQADLGSNSVFKLLKTSSLIPSCLQYPISKVRLFSLRFSQLKEWILKCPVKHCRSTTKTNYVDDSQLSLYFVSPSSQPYLQPNVMVSYSEHME